MSYNYAKGMSTSDIRSIALTIRSIFHLEIDDCFNSFKLLDVLTFAWGHLGFNYVVVSDDSDIFDYKEEAKTDIVNGTIYFKESVFKNSRKRPNKRASFTSLHEIGHFVLHRELNNFNLARGYNGEKPKPYEDPEWQADTFASEFLMPYDGCLGLSAGEIMNKYHVSKWAADVRYNKIQKSLAK